MYMKIRYSRNHRFTILATVAALGAFAPALRADWGSLRSNNRPEQGHEAEQQHHEAERGRPPVAHGTVVVEHGHPAPVRVVEPRHWDVEAERRHGYYWAGYHPGLTIGVLPAGYIQVSFGGTGYYYYDGVYFRPTPGGPYAVVPPPVGVIVPQLPDGAETVMAGPATYYYAAGAFYVPDPRGFVVVTAPLGVVVHGLPPGATPVLIEGKIYYFGNSTYFLPVMVAGVTVYIPTLPAPR